MIHPTAEVSEKAEIGEGTNIWNHAQIREDVKIGKNCIIGKNVYIDFGVTIGDNCKIQNNCSIYHGAILEEAVFLGPNSIILNDSNPRAINPDGSQKTDDDWEVEPVIIKKGASIGGHSTINPGITIGKWALIGSHSNVLKDVQDYICVVGNPAKPIGKVNKNAKIIERF